MSSSERESRPRDLWLVGRLGRPVGLRGECNVIPVSSDPADLERASEVRVRLAPPGGDALTSAPRRWTSLRWQGRRAVGAFEGLETREAIAARTHWEIWVDPEEMPEAGDGAWWSGDLIGCALIDGSGGVVGEVTAFLEGAAHDYLEVRSAAGRVHEIPFVKAYLREVDVAGRVIRMELPGGLVE